MQLQKYTFSISLTRSFHLFSTFSEKNFCEEYTSTKKVRRSPHLWLYFRLFVFFPCFLAYIITYCPIRPCNSDRNLPAQCNIYRFRRTTDAGNHLYTPIVTFFNELSEIIIPFNPIHASEYFAYLRIIFSCKGRENFGNHKAFSH